MTNEVVAENYSAKRVNYLKSIADDIWEHNSDSYIIFEHFQNSEERVFSDYGIMSWGEENFQYNEATMGYPSDLSGISHKGRQFPKPTLIGYMESHDKERLMYKNLSYGNSNGFYNIQDFDNAINRMKAAGSVFLLVPGPKMIWQFGELGYDISINTCENGDINDNCRLSKKKSAFQLNMDTESTRVNLYNVWSRLIELRKNEDIFKDLNFSSGFSSNIKYLKFENSNLENIKKVIIVANFGLENYDLSKVIVPNGEWYDIYKNNTKITLTDENRVSLNPGQFIILADNKTTIEDNDDFLLSSESLISDDLFKIYPNPNNGGLNIKSNSLKSLPLDIKIYNQIGTVVLQKKINHFNDKLNLKFLKSGLYNIKISNDKLIFNKKIFIE